MGSCFSRVEREEMVLRCKARKRYMKQLLKARHSMSASHALYLRSLRTTGSALLQFSTTESTLLPHPPPPPSATCPTPPPPPPLSPLSSETWTTTTTSSALPPPPPPPPPVHSSTWDFWDPFMPPPPSGSVSEEEWEEVTTTATTIISEEVAAMTAPPSVVSGFSKETSNGGGGDSEYAIVVSRTSKDLVEIVKEVDEYFLKAADSASQLSLVLEVSIPTTQSKAGYFMKTYSVFGHLIVVVPFGLSIV